MSPPLCTAYSVCVYTHISGKPSMYTNIHRIYVLVHKVNTSTERQSKLHLNLLKIPFCPNWFKQGGLNEMQRTSKITVEQKQFWLAVAASVKFGFCCTASVNIPTCTNFPSIFFAILIFPFHFCPPCGDCWPTVPSLDVIIVLQPPDSK